MGRQINLRVSDDLLAAIDVDRADVPRNRYIVRLLEGALGVSEKPPKPVEADRVLKDSPDPRIVQQVAEEVLKITYRCTGCARTAYVLPSKPAPKCPFHGVMKKS